MLGEILKRLFLWAEGMPQGPVNAELSYTKRCNLDCRFCNIYQAGETKQSTEEIPTDKCLELIKEGKKLGIKSWLLSGEGEPLIDKRKFLAIAQEIKQASAKGTLVTNATLLDQEIIDTLIEKKWDIIHISIQAADEKIHDKLVGCNGAHKKIIDNIQRIQRKKGKQSLPLITFNITIQKDNHDKLVPMMDLAKKLGVVRVVFFPLVTAHPKVRECELSKTELKTVQKQLLEIKNLGKKYCIHTALEGINIQSYSDRKHIVKRILEI